MKLILELKDEPKEDDVLIFDGKKWKPISRRLFLLETDRKIKNLSDEMSQFKSDVNDRLRDLYDVLQLLTQKEE